MQIKVNGVEGHFYGAVRFIGEISGSEGTWIGVSLDKAAGKNNGSLKGLDGISEPYFVCSENHGMFVRSERLQVVEERAGLVRRGVAC